MENNKKVILVVEDEKPLLEAIKIKLEKNNFEVVVARTIDRAKQYFKESKNIDAIWLDHYLLGKENGLDFIAWCKHKDNVKCNNIPFFIVSNTASSDKVSTYMSLGAVKYFVKSNHKLDEIITDIKKSI
jgi:DNA-binding response OmpR family regulator